MREAETEPAMATDEYWIVARRRIGTYPAPTSRSGKWLVFVPNAQVDEIWEKIKSAVESGRLGDEARVSTNTPRRQVSNPDERVICVYTYDCEDEDDRLRIREELRCLGVVERIPYKSDADTSAGKYRAYGHEHIGKYFE